MSRPIDAPKALLLAACGFLAACASPDPVAYRGVASSPYLRPDAVDDRVPYRFSTEVDWRSYDKAIVDPVEIYRGADNQFGDLSEADKTKLAGYMQTSFTEKLGKRFGIVNKPETGTLRIRLTLTGVETNTPVLSTFMRFDLAGGIYNGVQAARDREGMMSGSVIYVAEIYDAASERLLDASVVKQYPGAYNVGATFGSLAAAETGVDKGAVALADRLR